MIVEWLNELIFEAIGEIESTENKSKHYNRVLYHIKTKYIITRWKNERIEVDKIFYYDEGYEEETPWLLFASYDDNESYIEENYGDVFRCSLDILEEVEVSTIVSNLFDDFFKE